MPRTVREPAQPRRVETWDDHRLGAPIRLEALYGLRRSELLTLRWSNVGFAAHAVSIDAGLVTTRAGVDWTPGKSAPSHRTIPLDDATMRALAGHRALQLEERLVTLMVRDSADIGELRAVADILGHSPDMLMKVYAHTLPESLRSVTAKIGSRAVP
jgi:integrase